MLAVPRVRQSRTTLHLEMRTQNSPRTSPANSCIEVVRDAVVIDDVARVR